MSGDVSGWTKAGVVISALALALAVWNMGRK